MVGNNQQPLVSIVIPCYNAEPYIGESIVSALNQTYPNKEVIVIDDGSTDQSLKVIESFGDRIRWETGPNQGGCAARNRGLSLAKGELIQFHDADDLLHLQKLSLMVPLAIKPDSGMVFSDGVRLDAETGEFFNPINHPLKVMDPVEYVSKYSLWTHAPLHKTQVVRDIGGFRVNLPCSQDLDLHLRIACHGVPFTHLPKVMFYTRRLPGSVSSNTFKMYKQYPGIVERAEKILLERNRLTDDRRRALAQMLVRAARQLVRKGQWLNARAVIKEARRLNPSGKLKDMYFGRAKYIIPFFGYLATESIVAIDDSLRHLASSLVNRSKSNGRILCDSEGMVQQN